MLSTIMFEDVKSLTYSMKGGFSNYVGVAVLIILAMMVATTLCVGPGRQECGDSEDNDGDGYIDLADVGCENKWDNDETNCGDGVCEGGENISSCSSDCTPECSDGIDNDNDGFADELDMGCANSSGFYDPGLDDEGTSPKCNLRPYAENLVNNSKVECDNDNNTMPDGWVASGQNCPDCIISWIDDPTGAENGKILHVWKTSNYNLNWPVWSQKIFNAKPDTWYEFSASYAANNTEPVFNLSSPRPNEIHDQVAVNGPFIWAHPNEIQSEDTRIAVASFKSHGPELMGWDNDTWMFRNYSTTKGFEDWRTPTMYFKTPKDLHHLELLTYNFAKGEGYFDNFLLREVEGNYDPRVPPLQRSGTLKFIEHNGGRFFPIIMSGLPRLTQNGDLVPIRWVHENGFNTVIGNWYRNENYGSFTCNHESSTYECDETKEFWKDSNLSVIVTNRALWDTNETFNDTRHYLIGWRHDPNSTINYTGATYRRKTVDNWRGFDNILWFGLTDEPDCKPHQGFFLPNFDSIEAAWNYTKNTTGNESGVKVHLNFCGTAFYPYTGVNEDWKHYYRYADVLTYSVNAPNAYPKINKVPRLQDVGKVIRRTITNINNITEEGFSNKTVIAAGLGTYRWSHWDGEPGWHYNQYIPFNLQRFQVWDQIINGATGVAFWGANGSLDDNYSNYSFKQITYISRELKSLENVLLEPEFYDEWNVSNDSIDVMMKKHDGKIYLFTAAAYYGDIHNVTIALDSRYNITNVTALNDVINGDVDNPINRIIPFTSNSFVDDFIGENSSAIQERAAPGYAVHIYEIEYERLCPTSPSCPKSDDSARNVR